MESKEEQPWLTWHREDGEGVRFGAWNFKLAYGLLTAFGCLWTPLFALAFIDPILEYVSTGTPPAIIKNGHGGIWLYSVFVLIFLGAFGLLWANMLLSFFGSAEVRVRGDECTISSGIGPIRRRWRFKVAEVTGVWVVEDRYGRPGRMGKVVVRAGKLTSFGGCMAHDRRLYIAEQLRAVIPQSCAVPVDKTGEAGSW